MTAEAQFEISPSQQSSIDELKEKIAIEEIPNYFDKTFLCYRFLKDHDFNVGHAGTAVKEWLTWRKEYSVNTIPTEYKPPEALKDYLTNLKIGYDKSGNPVYYAALGRYDVRGLHMVAKYIDILKCYLLTVDVGEKMLEEKSKSMNKWLEGMVFIFNFEGLTFANATNKKGLQTAIRLFKMVQDNYPGRMKAIYMVNASSYFTLFFSILKSFLSQHMLSRIHVSGTEGWQEELLKFIDTDQLPAFMGGTRTDPDGNPQCSTWLNIGGKIDEKFYIHKSTRSLSKHPDVKKLVLSRAAFSEIFLEVVEAGSCIEYEFETKTRDIGFGLFHSEKDGDGDEKVTEIVPLQRMETEDFTETGFCKCDRAGRYVMLFDNSYSWVRSKEIYYLVKVKAPKDIEASLQ